MDKELSDLLDDIKGSKPALNKPNLTLGTAISASPSSRLVEGELGDFILKNTQSIVENGVNIIEDMKNVISQTIDPDEVSSMADLIKATTSTIEILNKIHIQNKKMENKTGGKIINSGNTNIFVGTREDALKAIENKKSIDVECVEIKDEEKIPIKK